MRVNKVDLSQHSYMNPLFNRIWWWTGELWWPQCYLLWWMSRRQRVCRLSQDHHCSSWELEKNEKKIAEITFYLLKLIMKIKVQAAFLWKVYLVQWGVWMEGYNINQHNPGMCYKNGQVIQLWSFHCFMIYDFFVHLIVQSFTKFSTQGTSVNCGAHKADSCADCPLVWRNLHV